VLKIYDPNFPHDDDADPTLGTTKDGYAAKRIALGKGISAPNLTAVWGLFKARCSKVTSPR